nr:hypothetical protein Iba_chr02bCG2950 [Ipomoea batatas]
MIFPMETCLMVQRSNSNLSLCRSIFPPRMGVARVLLWIKILLYHGKHLDYGEYQNQSFSSEQPRDNFYRAMITEAM